VPVVAVQTKECRGCNRELSLTEYYAHPDTPDRRFGKCKACHIAYVRHRYYRKRQDPDWREKERARQNEKHHRLYATGWKWVWHDAPDEVKKAARLAIRNAVRRGDVKRPKRCQVCKKVGKVRGPEAHHPDYHKPLDVVWVCRKCHAKIHRITPEGKLHPLLAQQPEPHVKQLL
jgi:hypothetical protein